VTNFQSKERLGGLYGVNSSAALIKIGQTLMYHITTAPISWRKKQVMRNPITGV
jgi:hypothetical protein